MKLLGCETKEPKFYKVMVLQNWEWSLCSSCLPAHCCNEDTHICQVLRCIRSEKALIMRLQEMVEEEEKHFFIIIDICWTWSIQEWKMAQVLREYGREHSKLLMKLFSRSDEKFLLFLPYISNFPLEMWILDQVGSIIGKHFEEMTFFSTN